MHAPLPTMSSLQILDPLALNKLPSDDLPCDIVLYLLAKLPIFDVLAFASISSVAFDLARHEFRARHRRMLRRFVTDPDALLRTLDLCDAIISGSFALNYAYGEGSWMADDLDLYVNPFAFRILLAHLVEHEGYGPLDRPLRNNRKLTAIERRDQWVVRCASS